MELLLRLPGADGEIEAHRATRTLADVLLILAQLETSQTPETSTVDATEWVFRKLSVACLEASFAPKEESLAASTAALRLVKGYALAEAEPTLPEGWTEAIARRARTVISRNVTSREPVQLRVIAGGQVSARAEVDRKAIHNLRAAVRATSQSIGSATGVLGSVSVRGRRPSAGLWPDRGGRLTVVFETDQLGLVKEALGQRVTVSGRFDRNSSGQVVRLRMSRLTPLPQPLPLTHLWGIDPGITEGKSVEEHLRRLRG